MFYTIFAVFIRIISNSCLNVFQKVLTVKGQKSSVVNFYTYLGLFLLILPFITLNSVVYSAELIRNIIIMGSLGALGNYFIIKALSIGELSTLAPINSYKPIVALVAGFLYLKEIPSLTALFGIILVIAGTYFIMDCTSAPQNTKAVLFRVLALIFSGTEAVFIKKIILLSDPLSAFIYWAISGLIFASIFALPSVHSLKITSYKYQILLVLSVGLMQYSTNFVFVRMNVSYALALFQLSTLLSVVLGAKLFNEQNLAQKLFASCVMVLGAILIIVTN